jgi:hypothetical protein
MKDNVKLIIGQISVQIACLLILGFLSFGVYIFEPKYTAFSYTIYGVTAILFYSYCRISSTRNFILLATLYSILMIIIFQRSTDILRLGRNIGWFILIGLLTYYLTVIEKKEWYLKSKAWVISSWLFGFIIVYMIMSALNIFLFCFYPVDNQFTVWLYIKHSVKIGGTLGIGIGLGNLISSYIFIEKLSV